MTERPRHLAVTHRYFWPQNYPYADMLQEITEALRLRVDSTTVLSVTPTQAAQRRERRRWADSHDVEIRSINVGDVRTAGAARKIASHLAYAAWLFAQLVRSRPDMTWVASTPPVIAGLAVRWASRLVGSRYIYHLQDIHPEAFMAKKADVSPPGLLFRLAQAVDRRTVKGAETCIVLSEDMRATLIERGIDPETVDIRVINNFVRLPEAPEPLAPLRADEPFVLLFAGGIGPFQALDRVLEVARCIEPREQIYFEIMGDGPSRGQLEEQYGDLEHVRFLGLRPRDQAHAAMCRASAGIVSLLPDITKVAYPSKVVDYSAFGLPIFALIDPTSGLAQDLRATGVALVPETSDSAEIAEELRAFRKQLVANPPERDALAASARERVSADTVVPQLATLVVGERGAPTK